MIMLPFGAPRAALARSQGFAGAGASAVRLCNRSLRYRAAVRLLSVEECRDVADEEIGNWYCEP
jgi:hypothetical protein